MNEPTYSNDALNNNKILNKVTFDYQLLIFNCFFNSPNTQLPEYTKTTWLLGKLKYNILYGEDTIQDDYYL